MQQALQLAQRGLGRTYPNPAVGCVIVKDGKVGLLAGPIVHVCFCTAQHARTQVRIWPVMTSL